MTGIPACERIIVSHAAIQSVTAQSVESGPVKRPFLFRPDPSDLPFQKILLQSPETADDDSIEPGQSGGIPFPGDQRIQRSHLMRGRLRHRRFHPLADIGDRFHPEGVVSFIKPVVCGAYEHGRAVFEPVDHLGKAGCRDHQRIVDEIHRHKIAERLRQRPVIGIRRRLIGFRRAVASRYTGDRNAALVIEQVRYSAVRKFAYSRFRVRAENS